MNRINKAMKAFYIVIILAGIHQSLLSQMVSYAPPRDEVLGRMLVHYPEAWNIVWTEDIPYEHTTKESLISYINMQFPWYRIPARISFHRGLVLLLLGLIGLARELSISSQKSNKGLKRDGLEAAP